MEEGQNKFHEFALKSILFKGRGDWYFCYLKSERVAQVLARIAEHRGEEFASILPRAGKVPESILYFAAGELDLAVLLADIFSLISILRICGASGLIHKDNIHLLVSECEVIAERMGSGTQLSPFVSTEELAVSFSENQHYVTKGNTTHRLHSDQASIKDIDKGQIKGHSTSKKYVSKEQEERAAKILQCVLSNNGVTIKDISKVVRNCSEKTIQRELSVLVHKGEIKKTGERRWSIYFPLT